MSWSAWHIVDAASQILSHMHDGSTQGSAGLPPKDLMQIPTFHIHTIPPSKSEREEAQTSSVLGVQNNDKD